MLSKNDAAGRNLNGKTKDDENLDEFFSKVDMNNIALDDAKRFSDPDTVKKYHEYIAAQKAAELQKPEVNPKGAADLTNPQERLENLRNLISKAIEKSGNDNGLAEALEKLSLFKTLPSE